MNIINELNEGKYTPAKISQIYYDEIYYSVKKFRQSGLEANKENYYKLADSDTRMDHVTYEEFQRLVKLEDAYEEHLEKHPVGRFSSRPGGIEGEEYRKAIKGITNKALVRRASQDMCEDVKVILNANYDFLYQLGYRGEQETAIPEIVRGNFKMFLKQKFLEKELSGCNEAIDRMRYVLKLMKGQRHGLDEFFVERYFSTMPIDNVRRQLFKSGVEATKDFREKFIADFYEEKAQRFIKSKHFDVENVQGKTIKKMMDGTMTVDESVYKKISDLGYSGKDEHPLIKSGYKIFVNNYALEKAKTEQLDYAKILYEDVCKIPGVRLCLEADDIPDSYNAMVGLADSMKYSIAKFQYKKGKISKAEFDKAKAIIEEEYRYGKMTMLSKNIKGMGNVDYDPKKDVSWIEDDR